MAKTGAMNSASQQLPVARPRQLATILAVPVAALVGINLLLGALLFFGMDQRSVAVSFFRLFDLNAENTIPTWYNSMLLAAAGVAALLAWRHSARTEPTIRRGWLWLTLIFFWMSMDESLAFHERTIMPLRTAFDAGGLFYWAWVIPAIVVVVVVGALFIPFICLMPAAIRRLVLAAGALYVFGALVMEMIGGLFFDTLGPGVLSDCASIVEETGEMLGVILFIYAAHRYVQNDISHDESPSRIQKIQSIPGG
jgi:hypothetical protein